MRGVEMAFSGMEEVLVVKIMKEVGSIMDAWVESKSCDLLC